MSYICNIRKSRDHDFGDSVGLQKELRKSIATYNGSNLDSPPHTKAPYTSLYIYRTARAAPIAWISISPKE